MTRYAWKHNIALLEDGRVLISGGLDEDAFAYATRATAMLYDPTTQLFTATGSMATARYNAAEAVLDNGKVLIAGGADGSSNNLASCELYDPDTGTWSTTGALPQVRQANSTQDGVKLFDGRVFLVAGRNATTYIGSVYSYSQASGVWSTHTAIAHPRYEHVCARLSNDAILVIGGYDATNYFAATEYIDTQAMSNTYTSSGSAASASNSYATLAELRADPNLQLAVSETASDDLLQDLLDAVRTFIDRETGRTFSASADTTRYFDAGMWSGGYLFPNDDLAQVTSIVNGDSTTLSASDYVTRPRQLLDPSHPNYTPIWEIKLRSSTGLYFNYTDDPEGAIAITGRWAYSVTPPNDIKRANIIGAAALYKASLNSDSDRPIVTASGLVIQPSQFPATFWAILKNYKRMI
jgi:hypothetical protein